MRAWGWVELALWIASPVLLLLYLAPAVSKWIIAALYAVAVALFLSWPFRRWVRERRARAHHQQGRCEQCGYSRRGLSSNRCPECGREFMP